MSPKAQRIAIAEACGLVKVGGAWQPGSRTKTGAVLLQDFIVAENDDALPSYLSDLNAIRAAVITLAGRQRELYAWALFNKPEPEDIEFYRDPERYIGYLEEPADSAFETYTASAEECAKAFLLAVGKWDDAK